MTPKIPRSVPTGVEALKVETLKTRLVVDALIGDQIKFKLSSQLKNCYHRLMPQLELAPSSGVIYPDNVVG